MYESFLPFIFLLIAVCAALISMTFRKAQAIEDMLRAAQKPGKYEYRRCYYGVNDIFDETQEKLCAEDGWEVFWVDNGIVYLKRLKQS